MESITANVILDTTYKGVRLISIETQAPKFIDAEIEKHRMMSSNSSSSRALQVDKTKKMCFIPNVFYKEKKGMWGAVELTNDEHQMVADVLKNAHKYMVDVVTRLKDEFGVHKQHLNRYLEPFLLQKKLITAEYNYWRYFLELRKSKYADPNIRELALKIEKEINLSEPTKLEYGMAHMPYYDTCIPSYEALMESAAICATLSYYKPDGSVPTKDDRIRLAKRLLNDWHMSPFEHQVIYIDDNNGVFTHTGLNGAKYSGNLRTNGIQFRKIIEHVKTSNVKEELLNLLNNY